MGPLLAPRAPSRLVGRPPNREALGAVVKVTVGDTVQMRQRLSAGSYLSQHDPRLHFGLGRHASADRVEITWPDRSKQILTSLPADRYLTVRQGP